MSDKLSLHAVLYFEKMPPQLLCLYLNFCNTIILLLITVADVISQEERKVVYVGKIPRDFTKYDLRRKLSCFGEICECSVHARNFGSVFSHFVCGALT